MEYKIIKDIECLHKTIPWVVIRAWLLGGKTFNWKMWRDPGTMDLHLKRW